MVYRVRVDPPLDPPRHGVLTGSHPKDDGTVPDLDGDVAPCNSRPVFVEVKCEPCWLIHSPLNYCKITVLLVSCGERTSQVPSSTNLLLSPGPGSLDQSNLSSVDILRRNLSRSERLSLSSAWKLFDGSREVRKPETHGFEPLPS